jgi:endonuclease/exonuclease/phosphatase (EEP) superfamily protein YafD
LALLSVLATSIVLVARHWWFFELFSHFRIQLLVFQLLLLVVFLILGRPLWVVIIGIASAVNGIAVGDYVVAGAVTDPLNDAAAEVRILSANVLSSNPDPSGLIDLLQAARPDVFAVIEFTDLFATALTALNAEYPHRVLAPEAGTFGIAVYSRWPIVSHAILDLRGFTAIDAQIVSQSGIWHFVAVHTVPPTGSQMASIRNLQLEQLAQHVADLSAPHVVAGDFNLTPFSPRFTDFLALTGLMDALRGRGPGYTWPVAFPPLGIAIDHVLVSAEFTVVDYARAGDIGSDHYPVIADIIRRRTSLD